MAFLRTPRALSGGATSITGSQVSTGSGSSSGSTSTSPTSRTQYIRPISIAQLATPIMRQTVWRSGTPIFRSTAPAPAPTPAPGYTVPAPAPGPAPTTAAPRPGGGAANTSDIPTDPVPIPEALSPDEAGAGLPWTKIAIGGAIAAAALWFIMRRKK